MPQSQELAQPAERRAPSRKLPALIVLAAAIALGALAWNYLVARDTPSPSGAAVTNGAQFAAAAADGEACVQAAFRQPLDACNDANKITCSSAIMASFLDSCLRALARSGRSVTPPCGLTPDEFSARFCSGEDSNGFCQNTRGNMDAINFLSCPKVTEKQG